MDLKEYSSRAIRFAVLKGRDFDLQHAALGLVTEVGEFADAVKKTVIYGKQLDSVNLKEEVGDILWYANLWSYTATLPLEAHDIEADYSVATNTRLSLALAGLAGAIGALAVQVELGDTEALVRDGPEFYIGFMAVLKIAATHHGFTLEEAADANIAKLTQRYPQGFNPEAALYRNLVSERAVLEAHGA